MKKIVSLVLLCLVLVGALASCGSQGFDYKNTDLSPYISLANYKTAGLGATVADLAATITDDDVNKEIDKGLEGAAAYKEKIKEFTVGWGDTVGIVYKGVLVSVLSATYEGNTDGTGLTADQIKALTAFEGGETTTVTDLTIGAGQFIEGFESSLVGLTVSEAQSNANFPIKVTFPEDYKSEDLAGKDAVFFVTASYKYLLQAERDIDFKDVIAMTYEIKLNSESADYAEYYDNETEEPKTAVYTLSKNSLFHSSVILNFNELTGTRFGQTMSFTDEEIVKVPNAEDETKKDDVTVKVDYTVTVHSIAMPVYFTHADIVATPAEGQTVEAGKISFKDFLKELELKEEDYADYPTFFAKTKENMQKTRDIQIKANRLQAAFDALVAASTINLDHADMKALIENYKNEVLGNIEYMTTYYQASGYGSVYESMASYYGLSGLEEYVMYTLYGYKKATINKELQTDAEEYVAGRLVFWQFVKDNGVTLSEQEYNDGLAAYKELYESDTFMEDNGVSEEALREALLWDKVAGMIADQIEADGKFTYKPEKEAE